MTNLSYVLQPQTMKLFTLHCFCEYNKRYKKHFHLKVECHWLAIVSSVYYHRHRLINLRYFLSFSSIFILCRVIGNIFEVFAKMTIVYFITICYLHISTNDNINQTTTLVYNVNEKILVYCIIVNCPSIYQNTCWDTNSDRYCIENHKRPEFQSFMMHHFDVIKIVKSIT